MTNILYSFRRCPYAMRGRMALHMAGIEYEHREVLLRDKPAAMLDASPKGTVPVFILTDGRVIDESLDLAQWALSQNDPENWLAPDINAMLALITQNDGPFKHNLDRYKYASRYQEGVARGDMNLEHRAAGFEFIAELEARLNEHDYLMSAASSLADVAIFPFIRQFANADKDAWTDAPYPKTQIWLENWVTSDLFKAIMTKHAVWQPC